MVALDGKVGLLLPTSLILSIILCVHVCHACVSTCMCVLVFGVSHAGGGEYNVVKSRLIILVVVMSCTLHLLINVNLLHMTC